MKNLLTYQAFNESLVNRKEDSEIFNYNSIIEDVWRVKIKNAQEFQKINFDLENNESLKKEKKTLYIKKNLRKDQPVKYEFNCQMCVAGGDWENMVMYFRVEFTHEYMYSNKKNDKNPKYITDKEPKVGEKLNKCYVFIPTIEGGNPLFKTEKGYTAYTEEYLKKDGLKDKDVKITDERKKKAWQWLEELLTTMVEERHEMLDKELNIQETK